MGLAVTLPEYLSLRGTRLAASWVVLPILLLLALAGFASAAEAQAADSEDGPASLGRVWLGPGGNPLPFKTDEEVMEFMRTAKVVSVREIGEGPSNYMLKLPTRKTLPSLLWTRQSHGP